MTPTYHKYVLPRFQPRRNYYRHKLVLGTFGTILLSLMLLGSYTFSSRSRVAWYPEAVEKSEEYMRFEAFMKSQEKKIVFIETSVDENFCLKLRQSCALESAARTNPEAAVILLTRAPSISTNCTTAPDLGKFPNFKIIKYTLDEVFDGTPLLEWGQRVQRGEVESPYMRSHLSDALRLAVVHKYSAIYVDLDFIVLRSFDRLFGYEGFLGREDTNGLNGALLGFRGFKSFTTGAMVEFSSTYRGYEWGFNGPSLMKRMLEKWECLITDPTCYGITILDPISFYPIHWKWAHRLFDDNSSDLAFKLLNDRRTLAVHFWNYLTYDTSSPVHCGNVLNVLGRMKCPTTFQLAKKTPGQDFI